MVDEFCHILSKILSYRILLERLLCCCFVRFCSFLFDFMKNYYFLFILFCKIIFQMCFIKFFIFERNNPLVRMVYRLEGRKMDLDILPKQDQYFFASKNMRNLMISSCGWVDWGFVFGIIQLLICCKPKSCLKAHVEKVQKIVCYSSNFLVLVISCCFQGTKRTRNISSEFFLNCLVRLLYHTQTTFDGPLIETNCIFSTMIHLLF